MSGNLLDNLDVFYGELTPARATVYARLEGLESTDELSLSGFVRGPRCFYSTTLLSTYPLADAGPGPSLLAKALVPDPCYWSPETPNIYDVTIELRRGLDVIASEVRQIGFKPLGISGRFFTWEGKPWVLRGVSSRTVNPDAETWRDRSTSMVFFSWTDDTMLIQQLEAASLRGIVVWILMPADVAQSTLHRELRRLARNPSVAGIVLLAKNVSKHLTPDLFAAAPNVLIGDAASDTNILAESKLAFHCLKPRHGEEATLNYQDSNQPLIVFRELGGQGALHGGNTIGLEQARAACDKLQADLAPYGQFAGYIV